MGVIYIGTSGWYYEHWYGRYYPKDLPKEGLLPHYAKQFNTVELNNTFYHLPKSEVVKSWAKKVPRDFLFAVKASRFITHIKKLRNTKDAISLFLKRVSYLGDKLGPVLYQLPPFLKRDNELLKKFLSSLPSDYKNVIEFRNESWLCEEVYRILDGYNVAFCIVSMPDFPVVVKTCGDFSYIRFHGASALYGSNYSDKELKEWADIVKKIRRLAKEIYIYFNNDANAYAIKNALKLKEILKV